MEHKQTEATITAVDEAQGIVEAIWAVMGNVDEGGDVIHPGAFTKTFSERGNKVKVLDQHRTDTVMSAVGITKELRELNRAELPQEILERYPDASGGAWGKFQFLLDTPEGKGVFTRIQRKAIQEWSFGYDPVDKDFSTVMRDGKQMTVRNLRQCRLYEVSPVLWGMNSATMTTDAKAVPDPEKDNPDSKAGRVLNARNAARIKSAYDSLKEALEEAGLMDIIEDDNDKSAGPPESADTSTSDAKEAGTPEDDSTRIKSLIQLEQEKLKLLEV